MHWSISPSCMRKNDVVSRQEVCVVFSCMTLAVIIPCTGMEEEYQTCARRREEKEGVLNDARAELDTLIADVEHSTNRLSELKREEDNARTITSSHPATISQLREKIECALRILSSSLSVTTTTNIVSSTAAVASSSSVAIANSESLSASVAPDVVEKMDTSDQ